MRALQFTDYGGPEVLTWGEAPVPDAGPGQIRIAVRAASVNPVDWKMFTGAMSGGQPLAGTGYLGYDAAGVVDEVGEGATGVSVGDEVFGVGLNTHAEYAVLNAWAVKLSSIDWAVAAAAGVAGETSERALRLLGVEARGTRANTAFTAEQRACNRSAGREASSVTSAAGSSLSSCSMVRGPMIAEVTAGSLTTKAIPRRRR